MFCIAEGLGLCALVPTARSERSHLMTSHKAFISLRKKKLYKRTKARNIIFRTFWGRILIFCSQCWSECPRFVCREATRCFAKRTNTKRTGIRRRSSDVIQPTWPNFEAQTVWVQLMFSRSYYSTRALHVWTNNTVTQTKVRSYCRRKTGVLCAVVVQQTAREVIDWGRAWRPSLICLARHHRHTKAAT